MASESARSARVGASRTGSSARSEDLGGTARTLDGVNGRLPLESGVVSRKGVGVIDDSSSMLFTDDGWVSPRDGERTDLYVFAYAHDFAEALRAFYALSGPQPILPRWSLGNWWSRYHRYTPTPISSFSTVSSAKA